MWYDMKRKFLKICFIFIIIAATVGCKQKDEWELLVFPVEKEVELEMIIEDPVWPNVMRGIDFYNGKLVMMYDKNDRHIHFVDAYTGEELGSMLHKGRGPGEIIIARKFFIDRETGTFSVYDFMSKKLLSGNIDSLYNGLSLYQVDENFGQGTYAVFPLQQGYFFCQSTYNAEPERRYSMKKNNGELVKYEGYPLDDFNLVHNIFSPHHMVFSRDRTKMVASPTYGMILEFFDLKIGIEKTKTRYFRKIYSKNDGSPDYPKSGVGMANVCGTDKYIYATHGEPDTDWSFNNIAIFDWEGNPVKIFRTKYKKLINICVDDEERFLYVVGEKEDGNRVLAKLDLTKH